jgi:hypothetical protein
VFDALQVFLLLLFCPINVVYRSSRFQFLRILRNIVLSPLYKVRTASAALCACSDQLFSDTSLCIIFLGPDCFVSGFFAGCNGRLLHGRSALQPGTSPQLVSSRIV